MTIDCFVSLFSFTMYTEQKYISFWVYIYFLQYLLNKYLLNAWVFCYKSGDERYNKNIIL